MDNRSEGYPARERQQVLRPKLKHVLRSFMNFASKKRSLHRNPSQSGNLQMDGIQELPDSQRIPSYNPRPPREDVTRRAFSLPQVSRPRESHQRRAPRRLSDSYPVTQRQDHTDTPALPPPRPLNATRYNPQSPQELGRRVHTMPPKVTPGTEIIIALMGVTGAGKSYFIREVTGNPEVKVSGDLYSCTTKVQSYSFEYAGAIIRLVDTPGFNDSEKSDTEVLQEIADWTSATYRMKQLLSGIIYLHPITHTRMEGSAMRNLRLFQSLCGHEALENVLLTTTQWSNVDPEVGQAREDNLRDKGLWGGLISRGATLRRFHGTRQSGFELIHKLMSHTRKPLDIQDQIVEKGMTLLETNAGKFLNEELIAQEEKFKEKVESLKREFRGAMILDDGEIRALEDEKEKAQKQLEKALAGMKLLVELHAAEVKRREARAKEEEARRSDRAVIAVATRDIEITAHITGVLTSYKTRGRLILDVGNPGEFESDTIEITINYQPNSLSSIWVYTRTLKEVFETNYIVLDGVHYQCKSSTPISVGSQEFLIFGKG